MADHPVDAAFAPASRVDPATIREFFAANTVLTLDTVDELRELEVGGTQAVFVLEKSSFFRRVDATPRRPDDGPEAIVTRDGHRFAKPTINKGPEGDKGKPGPPGYSGDKGLPGDNVPADSNLRKVSIPFNIFAQDGGVIPAGDYGWVYTGFDCTINSFDVVADAPEPTATFELWITKEDGSRSNFLLSGPTSANRTESVSANSLKATANTLISVSVIDAPKSATRIGLFVVVRKT